MGDHVWRPDKDDVERISWGKPAKKKGTGSRGVPHRLNMDERFLFDKARKRGVLEMEGSGWRSQRREAPLWNSYRSYCDARGRASIVLHKGNTGIDELVVDISPLRYPEIFPQVADACLQQQQGGEVVFQGSTPASSCSPRSFTNSGNEIKSNLTGISAEEDLVLTLSIVDSMIEESHESSSPWETRPIYQLPPYCISWELPRNDAKALGKHLAQLFDTIEETSAPSRKPVGVKPGKGRRHGGYGIG